MNGAKQVVSRLLGAMGLSLVSDRWIQAGELSQHEKDLVRYVLDRKLSMGSTARLVSTLKACNYVVDNGVLGDFVEAGVWRGGHGLIAGKVFQNCSSDRQVWMFDTFGGMTEPSSVDRESNSGRIAIDHFKESQQPDHNDWCYSALGEVKNNIEAALLDLDHFSFVIGDVEQTLLDDANLPDKIAVLRLDTDWYASTLAELEVLYPRLSVGGVLILDDYGHWDGARLAVDEYFRDLSFRPLLSVVDYSCRIAIKV